MNSVKVMDITSVVDLVVPVSAFDKASSLERS